MFYRRCYVKITWMPLEINKAWPCCRLCFKWCSFNSSCKIISGFVLSFTNVSCDKNFQIRNVWGLDLVIYSSGPDSDKNIRIQKVMKSVKKMSVFCSHSFSLLSMCHWINVNIQKEQSAVQNTFHHNTFQLEVCLVKL